MQVCKYVSMRVCTYMQVCMYMQVCKYASMQVCKYASMKVCKYARGHLVREQRGRLIGKGPLPKDKFMKALGEVSSHCKIFKNLNAPILVRGETCQMGENVAILNSIIALVI